ncbi:MAG: hypothetical protein GWN00_19835 [Aliifodinibius sp.]|nr:ERF family protein [Fodinibius sp.]NIY26973.1 hypothetical protein [Fodinibius sp.]
MSQAITKRSTQKQITTPMQLLAIATQGDADVDKLERLMAMQERWEASQAQKAFFEALSDFQSKVPSIKKMKDGHNYKYAPLSDIAEQIRETLRECGISYRFEQKHDERITVTCIITHIDGHSERTTMSGQADQSGSKNGIQAIGSTVTYLQRYTLIGALGITTADEDMDGRLSASGGDFLSGEQIALIEKLLVDSGANRQRFLKCFSVKEPGEISASLYTRAVDMLEKKIAKGKENDNS